MSRAFTALASVLALSAATPALATTYGVACQLFEDVGPSSGGNSKLVPINKAMRTPFGGQAIREVVKSTGIDGNLQVIAKFSGEEFEMTLQRFSTNTDKFKVFAPYGLMSNDPKLGKLRVHGSFEGREFEWQCRHTSW
jgi:hypothetical protein